MVKWEYCEVAMGAATYFKHDGRHQINFEAENEKYNVNDMERRGVEDARYFRSLTPQTQTTRAKHQNRVDQRARFISDLGLQGWEAFGAIGEQSSSMVILFKRQL